MEDRVVVGYDASPESLTAVRWAAVEAARRGWALDVVHAWGFAGQPGGGAGDSWLGTQVHAAVEAVAEDGARLAREAAPGIEVRGVVEHGAPAAALVERAGRARVVVLGRHGAGRFPGALIGSVTSGVLQHAPCPVVVVPEGVSAATTAGAPVVVGFDGSAGAYGALEAACDEARLRGVAVSVVVAWRTAVEPQNAAYWTLAYPGSSPAEAALDDAERLLHRAEAWAGPHDVVVQGELMQGRAQDALVRRSRHAGLVVVGTRGRGGFTSLVLGSVSRAVVQRAHCPVLVTRSARACEEAAPRAGRRAVSAG